MRTVLKWLFGLLAGAVVSAGCASAVFADTITVGYLALERDARYDDKRLHYRNLAGPLGAPVVGAEVALRESRFVGQALGLTFALQHATGRDAPALIAHIERLHAEGVRFFLVDAPGALVAQVAQATHGRDLLLFNVSAPEDALRQALCQSHLLHTMPNHAMQADALAQYLISKKWRSVLLLVGPLADDELLAAAFERSAKRFGLKIVARRAFVLSHDPRLREQGNVALLTGGVDYDAVFVADSDGEFARGVAYRTVRARPVVGSEGLVAAAWHWAWERHGAPQLNTRLERHAGRRMADPDWASWIAVKAVVEAVVRTENADFASQSAYLTGEEVVLDGFKGNRLNFRPWDRQLRQPILLATHNAVVERAPIQGFLHQHNNMDTLGFDRRDSNCNFKDAPR